MSDCTGFWKRLMGRGRTFAFCLCGLMLAGCVPATGPAGLRTAGGATAKSIYENLVIDSAIAEVIAQRCAALGIRRTFSGPDDLARIFLREMVAQGFSSEEIEQAAASVDGAALSDKATDRLIAKGVQRGNVAAFCVLGVREIGQGTGAGRFLRIEQ